MQHVLPPKSDPISVRRYQHARRKASTASAEFTRPSVTAAQSPRGRWGDPFRHAVTQSARAITDALRTCRGTSLRLVSLASVRKADTRPELPRWRPTASRHATHQTD
jgi:hypothetical protein